MPRARTTVQRVQLSAPRDEDRDALIAAMRGSRDLHRPGVAPPTAAGLDDAQRALLAPAPAPRNAAAMKAVLTKERFSDPDWIFERKLDGVRCVAIRGGGPVRLLSRNDLSLNSRYPEMAAALDSEACERFAVDGEIVAFDGAKTSFARLAQRGQHHVPVFYYEFDLLWLLIRNRGRVVTRDSILARLWDYDAEVETRTVDVHIRSLRRKLGDERIETVVGLGYRYHESSDEPKKP